MDTDRETTRTRSSERPLIVAASVVAVLVVAAVVVVLTGPRISDLDPASPEGVVQRYVQAAIDGDEDLMSTLVAYGADDCTPVTSGLLGGDDSIRVTLGDVRVSGDDADVDITVTRSGGGPLDPYEWSDYLTFDLARVDGVWLIERAPWPFQICEEMFRP
jgi:hypothetical protein